MVSCSISRCGNSTTKCNFNNKGITFHRFPKCGAVKDKWISATGKKNWFPTNYSRICSEHFNENDFNPTTNRRFLNKSAIPTVNIWKLTTVPSTGNQDPLSSAQEPTDSSASSSTPPLNRVFQLADVWLTRVADSQLLTSIKQEPVDPDSPKKEMIRREIQTKPSVIAEQRLKIKSLQCKVRRYRKRILILKGLLKNLKEKRIVTNDENKNIKN